LHPSLSPVRAFPVFLYDAHLLLVSAIMHTEQCFKFRFAPYRIACTELSACKFSGNLPGSKLKHFTEKKRGSDVDAEQQRERQILLDQLLAGTLSTHQAWRHLTTSSPLTPDRSHCTTGHPLMCENLTVEPSTVTYDDGAPIIDHIDNMSNGPRWGWVSPRTASITAPYSSIAPRHSYLTPNDARNLYRAGVGQPLTSTPHQNDASATLPEHVVLAVQPLTTTQSCTFAAGANSHPSEHLYNVKHPLITLTSLTEKVDQDKGSESIDSYSTWHQHRMAPTDAGSHKGCAIEQRETTEVAPDTKWLVPAMSAAQTKNLKTIGRSTQSSGRQLGKVLAPSNRVGTVAVVDGSQRGPGWGLKAGDRPWK